MPRIHTKTLDVADASLTGFLSNATGATWTLTTTATSDGLAHQVSIRNDSATDHSAKTAILTGTDAQDKAQTETINLPNTSATVESTSYFKTLTSVVPSATIGADTMDIGWVDEVSSGLFPTNYKMNNVAPTVSVDVTGTIDFTVQETFVDVMGGISPVWSNVTALATKTADTTAQVSLHATAIRVIINSYSSGAELTYQIIQSRID